MKLAREVAGVLAQAVRDTIQSVSEVPVVIRHWVREALDWLGVTL